jgi:hypothetical protein
VEQVQCVQDQQAVQLLYWLWGLGLPKIQELLVWYWRWDVDWPNHLDQVHVVDLLLLWQHFGHVPVVQLDQNQPVQVKHLQLLQVFCLS